MFLYCCQDRVNVTKYKDVVVEVRGGRLSFVGCGGQKIRFGASAPDGLGGCGIEAPGMTFALNLRNSRLGGALPSCSQASTRLKVLRCA